MPIHKRSCSNVRSECSVHFDSFHSGSQSCWELLWSWHGIYPKLIKIFLYLIQFLKCTTFKLCFFPRICLALKGFKLAQVSKWIVYKWYSAVWVIAYNSLPFESISCVKSTLLIRPVFMFREPAEPASFSPSFALFPSLAFVLNYWGTAVCTSEA